MVFYGIQFDILDDRGKMINRYFLRLYFTKGGLLSQKPLVLDLLNVNNLPISTGVLLPADVTKLKTMVGWKPEVSLDEGLKMTLDWYKANPKPQTSN